MRRAAPRSAQALCSLLTPRFRLAARPFYLRAPPPQPPSLRPQLLLSRWLSSAAAEEQSEQQQQQLDADAPPFADAPSGEPAVRYATRDDAFLMFESPVYSRMVNMIMQQGKKETARKHMWRAMERIRERGNDPQEVFYGALDNVRPMMEMKTFRAGQVPFPLNPRRSEGQAMKWIVWAARGKKGAPKRGKFDQRLANELLAAYDNKGGAIARKQQVHKEAVANQAAAHFRWRTGGRSSQGEVDINRKLYRPMGRRSIKRLQASLPVTPPPRPQRPPAAEAESEST